MTRLNFSRIYKALVLATGTTLACSGPLPDDPVGSNVEPIIRDPNVQHLADATGGSAGRGPADPSVAFDSRRDAFEDESPSLGEDPDVWKQEGGSSSVHRGLHGTRRVRQ